jgi:hypothetical protein
VAFSFYPPFGWISKTIHQFFTLLDTPLYWTSVSQSLIFAIGESCFPFFKRKGKEKQETNGLIFKKGV